MVKSISTWDWIGRGQYALLGVILFGAGAVSWGMAPAVHVPASGTAAQTVFCVVQAILASIVWAWAAFTPGLDTQETTLMRRFAVICFHAIALSCLYLSVQLADIQAKIQVQATILTYMSLCISLGCFALESLEFPMQGISTIGQKIVTALAVLLCAVVLCMKALGLPGEKIADAMPLFVALTLLAMPGAALFGMAVLLGTFTRDEYKEAVRRRMWDFVQNPLGLAFFYGLFAVALAWLALRIFVAFMGAPWHPFAVICPGYLVGLFVLWHERKIRRQTALNYATLFAPAKIFLRRFADISDKAPGPWAATMGLQTANFIIDCDPQNDFTEKMTATLGQIRKDEIHMHIEKIIGGQLMSLGNIDTKIYGSINPETSLSSCVDILIFFALVNIDIIPLVERRLKVLTSLFPIVYPALARLVTPQTISQLSSKMNWTFFLEFDWVDQSFIRGIDRIQYLVKSDQVPLLHQNRMLSYIQKISKSGNVVWIGEHARRRIAMEAPFLAGTIESWQIPPSAEAGPQTVNNAIYLIKFDKLIPHLQQYYNLEARRRLLRDYDERVDTRKFLNMIRMQLSRADSAAKVGEVLRTLGAFDFYGFREKDGALHLCLEAFEKSLLVVKTGRPAGNLPDSLLNHFMDTIKRIGYPGQILHMAFVDKHAIRDARTIITLCKSPSNSRFYESWALLLTWDARHFEEDELLELMQLIIHGMATPAIHTQMMFRTKCIELFVNIAAALHDARHYPVIVDGFNKLAAFLVSIGASVEHIAFFWDAKIHIDDKLGTSLSLTLANEAAMQRYMQHLRRKWGDHSSQFMAIENRLKAMVMLDERRLG